MGVKELLKGIKEDTGKYFQERDTTYLEMFLNGYCAANTALSEERLDRIFSYYFGTWLKFWVKENIDPDFVNEKFCFHGYWEILPKDKEEFAYFLELCDLCIEDYEDDGGSILNPPWSWWYKKDENPLPPLREYLLYYIGLRPPMYVPDLRLDYLYYQLLGRSLAYCETDFPHDEIEETFCQKFGEWLSKWIRENIDRKYNPQSYYWYEDVRRILPEGKEELAYFLELSKLFFLDYDGGEIMLNITENSDLPGVEISETTEIVGWKHREHKK